MKKKNILLSLLSLIMGLSISNAQDTLLIEPVKIDSLQQLIDARAKEDEEKVRLLNEYARLCFYNQEFAKGFVATRDARQISKNLNFTGGEIMYYHTLAAFSGSGEMHNYYLQQARDIALKADSPVPDYPEPIIPIGYRQRIDHQQLLDKLQPILDFFKELDDKEIQLTLMDPMAWSYYRLGRIDELKIILKNAAELSRDLNQLYPEFLAMTRLKSILNSEGKVEESKMLEQDLINLLSKGGDDNESAYLKFTQATYYNNSGQYALAIDYYLKSAEAFEDNGNLNMLVTIYNQLGYAYESLEMQDKAFEIYEKYISIFKILNDYDGLQSAYHRPVLPLYELKRYDEARKYMSMALQGSNEQRKPLLLAKSNMLEGLILMDSRKYSAAIPYLQKTYETYRISNDIQMTAKYTISFTLLYLAECYLKLGNIDNALKYALECLQRENALNSERTIVKVKISYLIAEIYVERGQAEKALDYIKMYQEIITESNRNESANRVAEAEIRSIMNKSEKQIEQLEKERIQKIQESKNQRLWIFSITGALLSAIIISLVLYRNNQNKQKANTQLKEQKEEIETTLEQLESTQTQLIQSEKMASLGELTAGIAHEIQNPLNFVNNFSEVNAELVEELKEEIKKGDLKEIEAIANDIADNEHKIKHHGQRAESIVKGMLQHSRTSTGEKESIDINTLADEYLRLAYHGLRAKDKSFNSDFKTNLDPSLPKINVIPQDIGRVLLNLINNAFQAVADMKKPEVIVTTKKLDNAIEIRVSDKGPGIPEQIREKIFQPFFTTKPTGQGTGLGLSLSYDIVKAHGGEIKVESEMRKGSEFVISLPIV